MKQKEEPKNSKNPKKLKKSENKKKKIGIYNYIVIILDKMKS
jgi:hypothetical protein